MSSITSDSGNFNQVTEDSIDILNEVWKLLITCDEANAMQHLEKFIEKLSHLISATISQKSEAVIKILPSLLQAMEEKNGILIADILQYEIKPILTDNI